MEVMKFNWFVVHAKQLSNRTSVFLKRECGKRSSNNGIRHQRTTDHLMIYKLLYINNLSKPLRFASRPYLFEFI